MKISSLTVAVTLVLGCDSTAPEVGYHTVRDSSGIEIIENRDHLATLNLGPRLYRIGSVDGPGALYRVTHAFLMDDGGVAVVESGTDLIKFFGRDGEPIRSIGGTGRGPGEFTGLWWASLGPADTLIAFDIAGSTTVSVFDPAGAFVRSFSLPRVGRGEPVAIDSWPSGALLILMQRTGSQTAAGQPYDWGLYSVGLDASITSDLGRWPIGFYRAGFEIFAHRAAFALFGTKLLYTPGDRFELTLHDEFGILEWIIRLERPRRPVTQDHIDAFWVDLRSRTAGRVNQEAMVRRLGQPFVADSMPAYTSILAAESHGFWARRAATTNDSVDVWDVFDARGVYIGAVTLPPRFYARDVSDRYVLGVTHDANDVEFVEAYEWTWPERAGLATSGVHSR